MKFHWLVLDRSDRARTGVERIHDQPKSIPSRVKHIITLESLHSSPEMLVRRNVFLQLLGDNAYGIGSRNDG